MGLHRLRIELHDGVGSLAETASALGRIGVDIVERSVESRAGGRSVDDLLLAPTVPLDLPAIAVAVQGSGARVLDLRSEVDAPRRSPGRRPACGVISRTEG